MGNMGFEERLQHVAEMLDQIAEMHVRAEERMDKFEERMSQVGVEHTREIHEIRAELRRGVRMSVEEQRRERARRQELSKEWDTKITQLASAQLLTEQKLQRLIDSLGNS